jgi:hypothetical protein
MDDRVNLDLFQRALGLQDPWEVVEVEFDRERRRLDLRIDFRKGARFPCPECGADGCKVHDTESHTWRHNGCPSEMRASTHIHGRNASTVDTVFVLRNEPVPAGLGTDFSDVPVCSVVDARLAALRRAGLTPTEADRACVRHSVLAARAMARLAESWDTAQDVEVRVARALEALGTPPSVAQADTTPTRVVASP